MSKSEPNTELDEIINEFITDTVTDTDTNVAHLKAELSKWRAQKVAEAEIRAYEHIRLSDNGMQEPLKSWLDEFIVRLKADRGK